MSELLTNGNPDKNFIVIMNDGKIKKHNELKNAAVCRRLCGACKRTPRNVRTNQKGYAF